MPRKLLCGPDGYCNARALRGEALARCPECQARDFAVDFWGRVFGANDSSASNVRELAAANVALKLGR